MGTFLFMYVFGFTINNITMMAMSLCVGLLIDDAIVVRENIVRHVQMGKSAHDAALAGTEEIGLAVLATTLSIVAVFLPIGFMGGIVGKFFHEFGITIVAAVLISMFVSFTLDPMLSSVWHDPQAHGRAAGPPQTLYDKTLGRVTGAFDRLTLWLSAGYQRLLAWALVHRLKTLGAALATFVLAVVLLGAIGKEFVPKADLSETQVNFFTPVGSSLEVTELRARQIDAALRRLPEVRHTVTTINSGFSLGKIYGSVYVRLTDRKDRKRSVNDLVSPMRELLAAIPGVTVTNIGASDISGAKTAGVLGAGAGPGGTGTAVARPDRAAPEGDSRPGGHRQLAKARQAHYRRSKCGVNWRGRPRLWGWRNILAGTRCAPLFAGDHGQHLESASDGENYDVRLSLHPDSRNAIGDLASLPLVLGSNADGSSRVVRLSQVADVRAATGPNQINRRDLNREINFDGNALGRSTGEITTDIRAALDSLVWPPGYRYSFSGATKNMQESFSYAVGALALAVVFIYMILASQFKSFLQPLALMSSLPLTLIGVVGALLLFRSTLNMFSVIGVVMLMGLVTKNAILLVDFAIRSREEGMDRTQALLHAAQVRLRPILMTTLAMVFGMVPLACASASCVARSAA